MDCVYDHDVGCIIGIRKHCPSCEIYINATATKDIHEALQEEVKE